MKDKNSLTILLVYWAINTKEKSSKSHVCLLRDQGKPKLIAKKFIESNSLTTLSSLSAKSIDFYHQKKQN